MANILEFKGVFYNPSSFTNYDEILAPPYDEISDELLEQLYRRSPYNIVRVEKTKEQKRKYAAARNFIDTARENKILIQDEKPGIMLYEQTFPSFSGKRKTRTGFISLLQAEDFYKKNVFPHEQTFLKPKQDRLKLLENCHMQVSSIFMFYEDKAQAFAHLFNSVKRKTPFISFKDAAGSRHRLWKIQDDSTLKRLKSLLKTKKVFIADGHHRYETGLWFYKLHPKYKPHAIMCFFVEMNDPGLEVLPIHRLVRLKKFDKKSFFTESEKFFHIKEFSSLAGMQSFLKKDAKLPSFGACIEQRCYSFTLKNKKIMNSFVSKKHSMEWKNLSVNILHHLTLEHILNFKESEKSPFISYSKDPEEAHVKMLTDSNMILFVLPPLSAETIKKLSLKRELMPRKSTFFYPKIPTGIVMAEIK